LLIGHLSLASAAVALAGCGYRPVGTDALPQGIRTIAIGPIASDVFRPGLQGTLGEFLGQRLRSDGRWRVVPSTEADAILEATISGYGQEGVAWDQNGVAQRFRVQVSAGFRLRARQTNQLLLSDGAVGQAYYTAGQGVGPTVTAEEIAARRALRELVDRLASRLIDGL
jgi:outer membrane lipopolysaccharide assembly protein LptE/RlpB